MPDFINKIKDAVGNKTDQKAQPGDKVEQQADTGANDQINNIATDAGVPQQDDSMIDKAADSKINSDIPFGNN